MSVVVGVTGPSRGGLIAWLASWLGVVRSGATAVRLTPDRGLCDFDALLIGGGSHVDPRLYEQSRKPDYTRYDEARDRYELTLARHALVHQRPILGICRGMQLLNVLRDGTLCQDAWANVQGDTRNSLRARFEAEIVPGSLLHRIVGQRVVRVNRLHRQSIERVGRGLSVTARGAAGVVQAIEDPTRAFVLGVQWHPEYLPHRSAHHKLIAALVQAASTSQHRIGIAYS